MESHNFWVNPHKWDLDKIYSWKDAISIKLAQNLETKFEGEQLIKNDQSMLNKAALLIWILVILMAFLGELKP